MAEAIPEQIKKYLDASEPKELRLTAAKGLLPLSPGELTHLLYLLTEDEDEEISSEARKSLGEIPAEVISSVLIDGGTAAEVLDYYGRNSDDPSELEKIIVNNSTGDGTVSHIAETTDSQRLIELISNNHERIGRSSAIVEALSKNPMVSRSTLDNVLDYLSLYLGEDADIPLRTDSVEPRDETGDATTEKPETSFLDDAEVAEELMKENDEEGEETDDESRENIQTKIANMTIGERIKTAIRGNREARTVLVRDPNRIVSRAVLKNPRLTDTEIVLISQSKIVNDDILREISDTRRWIKMYPVKLALVCNPKTPPHISVNLIRQLRDYDLRTIMWSKNLPGVITTTARNIMKSKRDGK